MKDKFSTNFTTGLAIFLAILSTLISLPAANAQCYGDAAEAYGCGNQQVKAKGGNGRGSPGLERFGSNEGPVLPDTGYYNGQNQNEVISPEERRQMHRRLVLGNGGSPRSKSIQNRAVSSASRPLRPSGSMPNRTR